MQKFVRIGRMRWNTVVVPLLASVLVPAAVMAATPKEEACKGAGGTFSVFGCSGAAGIPNLTDSFQLIANTLIFLVGAISVIMIIVGGLRYVLSNGDASGIKGAKDTILYAIVGVVVAILAFAIVNFVISRI